MTSQSSTSRFGGDLDYSDHIWIETPSGKKFYPGRPEYDVEDIAHALAFNCRYNGHTKRFYSVAEHSILVSVLMEEFKLGSPLEGLLHDATEAYLTDVPAPFKSLLPDWKALDLQMENALRDQFGLPRGKTGGCREADELALFIEAYVLMPGKGEEYYDPNNVRPRALELVRAGYVPLCLDPDPAKAAFLKRWDYVRP